MDRRKFLSSLIGGVAAAAAARTFPFRVFSFPKDIQYPAMFGGEPGDLSKTVGPLTLTGLGSWVGSEDYPITCGTHYGIPRGRELRTVLEPPSLGTCFPNLLTLEEFERRYPHLILFTSPSRKPA
jgi:hypothetical protein